MLQSADRPTPEQVRSARLTTGLVLLVGTILPLLELLWFWPAPVSGATCDRTVPACRPGQGLAEWWVLAVLLVAAIGSWVRGAVDSRHHHARGWMVGGAVLAVVATVMVLADPVLRLVLPPGYFM